MNEWISGQQCFLTSIENMDLSFMMTCLFTASSPFRFVIFCHGTTWSTIATTSTIVPDSMFWIEAMSLNWSTSNNQWPQSQQAGHWHICRSLNSTITADPWPTVAHVYVSFKRCWLMYQGAPVLYASMDFSSLWYGSQTVWYSTGLIWKSAPLEAEKTTIR